MRNPIYGSYKLLAAVTETLGLACERLPVIIGIDGRSGAGKSSVAAWLGEQLGVPVIALDQYIIQEGKPLEWRYQDLTNVLQARLEMGRPLIIEGICLCQALLAIDRDPDFRVWVQNDGGPEHSPEKPTDDYINEFDPMGNADFTLTWHQPEPA